jgi:regulator of protease activity HflC (stomatin/prohibitin superfamily)
MWKALFTLVAGCATVPVGNAGIVITPSGVESEPIREGVSYVGPFADVTLYDVRAQLRNEDLVAISSDGSRVQANASLVAFHLDAAQLPALEREVGPSYYEVLIRPTVQATLRRVVARYAADDFNSPNVAQIETDVAAGVAESLRHYPIAIDRVDLRTLAPVSEEITREIQSAAIWEQRVQAMPQEEALARARGAALRQAASSVLGEHAKVAPSLNAATLARQRTAAWAALLSSPHTDVEVEGAAVPSLVEVEP